MTKLPFCLDQLLNSQLPSFFTDPPLPAGSSALGTNGALNEVELVQIIIKTSPGYTEAIGQDLGIIGSTQAATGRTTLPKVTDLVAESPGEISRGGRGGGAAAGVSSWMAI